MLSWLVFWKHAFWWFGCEVGVFMCSPSHLGRPGWGVAWGVTLIGNCISVTPSRRPRIFYSEFATVQIDRVQKRGTDGKQDAP